MSRFAVVTGAGSGIGRAVTLALSSTGVTVVAVGRRESPLCETQSLAAGPVRIVVGDVADPQLGDRVQCHLNENPVHFLVHAAGQMQLGRLLHVTRQAWETSFATLVHGRLYLTQALAGCFLAGSRVVLISSRSSRRPRCGAAAYCCAYAASVMLGRCLRAELESSGVSVVLALPGSVDTALLQASIEADRQLFPDGAEYQRERDEGRLIAPRQVGRFVNWLLAAAPEDVLRELEVSIEDPRFQPHWLGLEPLFSESAEPR